MKEKPTKARHPRFRVFADDQGLVFLTFNDGGPVVEVVRPVTSNTLDEAKQRLIAVKAERVIKERAAVDSAISPTRRAAQEEIEAAINPIGKGRWRNKLDYGVKYVSSQTLTLLVLMMMLGFFYKGVQYLTEHLPEPLRIVVLVLYVIVLAWLLYATTEENEIKYRKHLVLLWGPHAMIVIPLIIVGAAAAILASLTFRMHNKGWVSLETCSGRAVSEAGLMDFYLWHFVNIIPSLQLTNLIRWREPYCYHQSRVGYLILLFQLLVVLPSFNRIRFHWKRRHVPGFVHDPAWHRERL